MFRSGKRIDREGIGITTSHKPAAEWARSRCSSREQGRTALPARYSTAQDGPAQVQDSLCPSRSNTDRSSLVHTITLIEVLAGRCCYTEGIGVGSNREDRCLAGNPPLNITQYAHSPPRRRSPDQCIPLSCATPSMAERSQQNTALQNHSISSFRAAQMLTLSGSCDGWICRYDAQSGRNRGAGRGNLLPDARVRDGPGD